MRSNIQLKLVVNRDKPTEAYLCTIHGGATITFYKLPAKNTSLYNFCDVFLDRCAAPYHDTLVLQIPVEPRHRKLFDDQYSWYDTN